MNSLPLVLASSSQYRKALLDRLQIAFETASPNIDERIEAENPCELARQLAAEKATALSEQYHHHLIIGSDQVANLGSELLGKPGNFQNARQQLLRQSGKMVSFNTAVAILNTKTNVIFIDHVLTEVTFRPLNLSIIDHYLEIEQPYDCAGSFKSEGLGIALFEKVSTKDPTALIGLPLIKTVELLEKHGVSVL